MRKKRNDVTITILVIILITTVVKLAVQFPWWFFVVPVLVFGSYIGIRKWNVAVFPTGFLAGFLIWFAGNFYFDKMSNGIIINKIALLLAMPSWLVFVISGLIGGLLTGLALYTGKSMVSGKVVPKLDEEGGSQ